MTTDRPALNPTGPFLEVVVVTYGSWASASVELSQMAVMASQREDVHWTFVDNSPGATDALQLRPLLFSSDAASVFELDNPGFAAACNYAVQASHAEWIFLLNPDISIDSQAIEEVVAAAKGADSRTSCLAVSQVTNDFAHAGICSTRYGWFTDRPISSGRPLLGPSGGAGVYRRKVFVEIGGLYEYLFAWGEDADLAIRLSQAGSTCGLLDLRLAHQGGHSVNANRSSRRTKAHLLARNRIVVSSRNSNLAMLVASVLVQVAITTVLIPRNLRRGTVSATWAGLIHGAKRAAAERKSGGTHMGSCSKKGNNGAE